MTERLARSPREGVPAQTYRAHVEGVTAGAVERATVAAGFYTGDRARFVDTVRPAAAYHDLGKLDEANQAILAQVSRQKLPIQHEDAGAAALLGRQRTEAGLLVACHHAGLFSKKEEMKKDERLFRVVDVADHVDQRLGAYEDEHRRLGCPTVEPGEVERELSRCGFTRRVALSCLVDADHSDSAIHTGGERRREVPVATRWSERRAALDRYVADLAARAERAGRTGRSAHRQGLYRACRDAEIVPSIRACDAPVGSGKTTAVMAHLLRVAEQRGLRHVFVVLPYTNIIRQSVDTYRKALVLPGEDPEEVVAEHHHQADFSDPDLRHLATMWRAPIVVTTAVQFFETLAACSTARLRKLHELPGSAVFLDEAHAAIPTHMWPQAWRWLQTWVDEWGGHLVLGSGSLARFWQNRELVGNQDKPLDVPDLSPSDLRRDLAEAESNRIDLRRSEGALSCDELIQFVESRQGPRLVILNTIQNAAVVAHRMRERGAQVLHLSTALAPVHRDRVIKKVERWLKETTRGERDYDWTLVATSCVEAGMDFSFRVGFRESASVASALQVTGRVNREDLIDCAETWDFRLNDPMLTDHPGLAKSRTVLDQLFDEGLIETLTPSTLTTVAFDRELTEEVLATAREIEKAERRMEYKDVASRCRVIDDDTETVLIDLELAEQIRRREAVDRRTVMKHCVRMRPKLIEERGLQGIFPSARGRRPELWVWGGLYDAEFLGYAKELVPLAEAKGAGGFLGV